jgi:hypothetical protein
VQVRYRRVWGDTLQPRQDPEGPTTTHPMGALSFRGKLPPSGDDSDHHHVHLEKQFTALPVKTESLY